MLSYILATMIGGAVVYVGYKEISKVDITQQDLDRLYYCRSHEHFMAESYQYDPDPSTSDMDAVLESSRICDKYIRDLDDKYFKYIYCSVEELPTFKIVVEK